MTSRHKELEAEVVKFCFDNTVSLLGRLPKSRWGDDMDDSEDIPGFIFETHHSPYQWAFHWLEQLGAAVNAKSDPNAAIGSISSPELYYRLLSYEQFLNGADSNTNSKEKKVDLALAAMLEIACGLWCWPTTRKPFKFLYGEPPEGYLEFLSNAGYLTTTDDKTYVWADKICRAMHLAREWDANGESNFDLASRTD